MLGGAGLVVAKPVVGDNFYGRAALGGVSVLVARVVAGDDKRPGCEIMRGVSRLSVASMSAMGCVRTAHTLPSRGAQLATLEMPGRRPCTSPNCPHDGDLQTTTRHGETTRQWTA